MAGYKRVRVHRFNIYKIFIFNIKLISGVA